MKPEIIIMLTHHDVTVKDAGEIFEQCKDLPVKFWGFKNVGLPKDEMKKVAGAMKAAGKTTFLEVVTYDEASCLDGAQTAIDCGFDYLMGTVYYDSVAKLLKENGMAYLPFVGKVSGSPSILEGTNEEIIQNAKDLMAKGIKGFDDLAAKLADGSVLMAMGNSDVPVGQYTQKILSYYKLDETALANAGTITYGTNVKEVTTQISEGSVDAGVVYCTDAYSAGLTPVDEATAEMCGQIIYPAAALKAAPNAEAAREFLAYLQTDRAATVFEGVGFTAM